MKLLRLMPLNLQFFAEADGASAGGNGTVDAGTGDQGANDKGVEEGQENQDNQPSFDDFLKDKSMQAEFDRRVAKALATQKAKNDEANKQAIQDALTEAEKLRNMNDAQKKKYEDEKREADYQKRLAELNARELKATAKETLASEGLPVELAEVLNYQDADSCNKSIEAVKTAFQAAVSKAVNEKLKGKGAPKDGAGKGDAFDAQLRRAFGLK